jgi:hypothetical protein
MFKRICVIGLGVVALAGCGGSSGSSSSSSGQTISLTRAAYVSTGARGYKTVMSMRESVPSVGQVAMNGTATFALPSHSGSMNMQMTIPGAAAQAAGLGTLPIQAVLVPGTIYMKLPTQLAEKLPGAKPWWQINLAQAGKLAGVPGLSSLMSGTSNMNDPGQYLYFLRATSTGSVKSLGQQTVNGVTTTHYQAKIDLSKLPNAVPAKDKPGIEQLVSALQKRGAMPASGFPVDAWIDSHNLIRQIEMNYTQPVNGQSAKVAMKMDFVDYGPQPAPQVPPPGQTVNLVQLLQQHGIGG